MTSCFSHLFLKSNMSCFFLTYSIRETLWSVIVLSSYSVLLEILLDQVSHFHLLFVFFWVRGRTDFERRSRGAWRETKTERAGGRGLERRNVLKGVSVMTSSGTGSLGVCRVDNLIVPRQLSPDIFRETLGQRTRTSLIPCEGFTNMDSTRLLLLIFMFCWVSALDGPGKKNFPAAPCYISSMFCPLHSQNATVTDRQTGGVVKCRLNFKSVDFF